MPSRRKAPCLMQMLSALQLCPVCAEAFSRMLLLEGIAEAGGLDEWFERLPASIPELPLTKVCRHLEVALFATVQATQVGADCWQI